MRPAPTLALALACTLASFSGAAAQPAAPPVLIADGLISTDPETPLRWPVAVAAGSATELAVADAHDEKLVIYVREGDRWVAAAVIRLAAAPVALAHDGTRYAVSLRGGAGLFGVEGERHQLRRMPLAEGTVPGPLAGLPGGGFLVFDYAAREVLRLDVAGAAGGRVEVGESVTGIAAAPDGGFWVAVAARAEVRRYGAGGALQDRWTVPGRSPVPAWPAGLAAATGGYVVVVDRHGDRLLVLDGSGAVAGTGSRRGWEPGLLRFPAGVARVGEDLFAVADQGNGRIQLFRRISEESDP